MITRFALARRENHHPVRSRRRKAFDTEHLIAFDLRAHIRPCAVPALVAAAGAELEELEEARAELAGARERAAEAEAALAAEQAPAEAALAEVAALRALLASGSC